MATETVLTTETTVLRSTRLNLGRDALYELSLRASRALPFLADPDDIDSEKAIQVRGDLVRIRDLAEVALAATHAEQRGEPTDADLCGVLGIETRA